MPINNVHNIVRPKLTIERTPTETALEILSVLGLLLSYYFLLSSWSSLPDKIPTHFGFDGAPDAWGSKMTLLLMPILATVIFAILTVLSRFPHTYNYPWRLTEQNAERQYRLARMLLTAVKMEVIYLFAYIEYGTIRTALGNADGLGSLVPSFILIALFGTVAFYFVKAWQSR
jgi:uncharacterized membrane protein